MTALDDHHVIPLAGVLGWPASHSLSPLLHGHWLQTLNIRGHYVPLECAPQDLSDVVPALLKTGFCGFNVTVPHKEAAFFLADHVTDRARHMGAVNTLWMEDGCLFADSTDGDGFLSSLPVNADTTTCVLLGAGGAAKSIAYTLCADAKTQSLHIINRSRGRAESLVRDLTEICPGTAMSSADFSGLPEALEAASLVINSTSLGMVGQDSLAVDLTPCRPHCDVYDIVYTPAKTEFLKHAEAHGLRATNGLGMLIEQARPGFARWFGAAAPQTGQEHMLLEAALKS
ncbi:MAG: shikimate dehydrogenase [Pseudomonadota bacterium]